MEIGLPEPYPTSTEYALGLATNPYLPWSLDLIEKYSHLLAIEQLAGNKGVWEKVFKPHVDKKMVDILFRLI